MDRRRFFTALGVALVTPSILKEVAIKSKPIYFTGGIINFIRGRTHSTKRPTMMIFDDMEEYNANITKQWENK